MSGRASTGSAPTCPAPKVLQGTLRKITETLARELAQPCDRAPEWTDQEWQLARAVAAMHGISPLLCTSTRWQGPADWASFAETQHNHVANRHEKIEALLAAIDTRAREETVPLMALKGAALHARHLYRAGERPMADIDLLVRPRDADAAGHVLESVGFSQVFANWKHRVFMPPVQDTCAQLGEHAGNYLKIELHERIAEILPFRATDVTSAIFPERPHAGLNPYAASAALMIHLLIHAASCMAYRTLRIIHLNDIARLCTQMSTADWDTLLHYRDATGSGPWWALPPLKLTARYYTAAVPPEVLQQLSAHCQWPLRQLTNRQSISDVSMSYLWIEAFPGLAWSRTAAAAVEYMRSRVLPDKEMRRLRRVQVETQVATGQSEWGSLSQRKRMLRWLVTRQPRADTLHAVRIALAPPMTPA